MKQFSRKPFELKPGTKVTIISGDYDVMIVEYQGERFSVRTEFLKIEKFEFDVPF
jgi:hypothetical protein